MTTPSTARRPELELPAIPRVPWSQLGPDFIANWGWPRGKESPEHIEILGPTGSGKSMLKRDMLLERARRRDSRVISIFTKAADETAESFGWPVVDTVRGVRKNRQCIFWPRTPKIGREREAYQAMRIEALLDDLWDGGAQYGSKVVDWDEAVWIEQLSDQLKSLINQYVREGRSEKITNVLGKQRTQGIQRDMHSETDWKFTFKMNDRQDNERVAELFGHKRAWLPVVESLDREKFEFLVQHKLTGDSYISWVDKPVSAARDKERKRL